ncbi:hypothetical protein VNI00_009263, partial [Paramarasmius palmivorus]
MSLVISVGLHRIRSRDSPMALLPPPADAVEEGERINALWAVLSLNNCWTSVEGAPSNTSGLGIDTPWPQEMEVYVK